MWVFRCLFSKHSLWNAQRCLKFNFSDPTSNVKNLNFFLFFYRWNSIKREKVKFSKQYPYLGGNQVKITDRKKHYTYLQIRWKINSWNWIFLEKYLQKFGEILEEYLSQFYEFLSIEFVNSARLNIEIISCTFCWLPVEPKVHQLTGSKQTFYLIHTFSAPIVC